jgi:hypothetical protein
MSKLGQMGRFANQVIQYMFLKTYARRHGFDVQTPPWIGQELFGFDDPPIARALPEFVELYDKFPDRMVVPQLSRPLCDVDFCGFFQYPSGYYAPDRDYIQDLFTPVPAIKAPLDIAAAQLRSQSRTIVGMHARRGDYGYDVFFITPISWYRRLLETLWPTLDRPLLFVATDDPEDVLPGLRDFNPVTTDDLGISLATATYFPDFYLLSKADVLVIPNSTFSFAASLLARNLRAAYRSRLSDPLGDPPFVTFDPWNSVMLDVTATVEDFPQIPGIAKTVAPALDDCRLGRKWLRRFRKNA